MITPHSYDSRFMYPTTLCRCGHILECCADCRGWLVEHSPRLERSWRWYVNKAVSGLYSVAGQSFADLAEGDDLAYYHSWRAQGGF